MSGLTTIAPQIDAVRAEHLHLAASRWLSRLGVWCVTVSLSMVGPMSSVVAQSAPPQTTADTPIPEDPLDWLNWRGPSYNGVSIETGLADDFDPEGGPEGNVVWRRPELAGRSTPIVMDDRLYTILNADPGTPIEGEKVVCVDVNTGETLWENRFNVYLSDVPDTRVGWSSCVADPETGTIFALGVCGHFQCIDARTGETRWYYPLHEYFGGLSTYGGRTNFPVVYDNLVIISAVVIGWGDMAKPAHRFIAFDKRTGDVVWFNGTTLLPDDTTYSSPTLAKLNQQDSLVFGSGDGAIWSFQPLTGRPIWTFGISRRGVNTPPLVSGSTVYAAHSEENLVGTSMGTVVAIDTQGANGKLGTNLTESGVIWRLDELMNGRAQPLLIGDRLWAFDDRAKLQIIDVKTGELVGRKLALGRMMHASPLYADGKVYALEANGRWAIYAPDEAAGATVVSSGRMPVGEEFQASPIVSHGRLFLQSTGAMYCIQDPDKTPGFDESQLPADEPDAEALSEVVEVDYVQVVPAEVLVKPGQTQAFRVFLYDHLGRRLAETTDATFEVVGAGHVTDKGMFTATKDAPHTSAVIKAKVGSLEGTARVRVVPDLPWKFTFDNGEIPVTWVGARYRHIPLDDDLFQSLTKADPLAGQLYIYFLSTFMNTEIPVQKFDNGTPAQKLAGLQRFADLSFNTIEEGAAALDAALKRLVEVKVLESFQWQNDPQAGPQLTVKQGPRKAEGNVVMTKITTIPKGTRSRAWFGPFDLSDYTIQADVRGAKKLDKLPDIGIVAQGYTLDLKGEHQELEIRTWDAQLRMARQVPFPWKEDQWYTLKLRASLEDGKAVLRGKAWPRDEPEPDAWTVEAIDESPNRTGSPGLYGNAKDAEIFLDNIVVAPN